MPETKELERAKEAEEMSDLISRSALILRLSDYALHESPNDNESTGEQRISKLIYDAIQNCIECVEEQPTAYDVEKIVEELELHSFEFGTDTLPAHYVRLNKAIEVVKQGGVGTETETIRDKAVKWNNNSSKRVPYEFIDYVEGRREIGASDDVCEWESHYKFVSDKYKRETGCGYTFYDLHHAVPFKYCPYCGKKIKAVE